MRGSTNISCAVCCALVIAGTIALAGPISPPAGPVEPTMKTLDEVEPRIVVNHLPGDGSAVHVIAEPGSYYLTANVLGLADHDGIKITSDDVTLDLNGFAVVGAPRSRYGVIVQKAPAWRISVKNGVIRDWDLGGLWASNSMQSIFTTLRVTGNGGDGMYVGDASIVRDVQSSLNDGRGIGVFANGLVESSTASDNGSHGIEVGPDSVVQYVQAASNGGDGIRMDIASIALGCSAESNTGAYGGGYGYGVYAHSLAVIADCVTSGNDLSGVYAGAHSSIRDTVSALNGVDGFTVTYGVRIDDCIAQFNGDDGYQVQAGCSLTSNLARDNLYGFYDAGAENSAIILRDNTATNNTMTGFLLAGSGALIAGNTARGNGSNFTYTPGEHQIGDIITALGPLGAVSPFANFAPIDVPPITDAPLDKPERKSPTLR